MVQSHIPSPLKPSLPGRLSVPPDPLVIQHYSLGLMIREKYGSPHQIVLIEYSADKADWQRGRWNGIGGRLERGESPAQAMSREFLEETGLVTAQTDWVQFARLYDPRGVVHCFISVVPFATRLRVRGETDEGKVAVHSCSCLPLSCFDNVRWLIDMGFSFWKRLQRPEIRDIILSGGRQTYCQSLIDDTRGCSLP